MPLWCAWQVTYRCNYRCRFCHYWRDPLGQQPEPSPDQYSRGARKLAQMGTLMVSLAGGEPLLRRDITDVIRAIGEFHFPFITTNGWFVTPQLAHDLMASGLWGVSVSIDYSDPERHDERRGMDGAWRQAWRAVKLLSEARVHEHQRINVMAVLLDDNVDQLEEVAAKAAQYGAHFMVQPYGYRKTGSRAYEHQGPVSQKLLDIRSRRPNFLSNPRYLARFDEFLNGEIGGCKAGRAFFNIDSTGDIAICVERKETPVANLYSDSFYTIRSALRKASAANHCSDCWYNCRGEIETLYEPMGLLKSLPTYIFDKGRT